MNTGRTTNQAILRTLANKEALNFATRRLLTDLKEFENNKIPTVGVSACPMDDDLFTWHANLRGPEGTMYEGGVFHLELRIPETYPHSPPKVELLVDLPHPNVKDNKVCLDMLENSRSPGKGWSSGYSIMSVLIQLQSFLFEKFFDDQKKESSIRKAIEKANQYRCSRKFCKHGGKLAAWPPFDTRETTLEAFKIMETEKELFEKELVCFHTKMTHEQNSLGIGLEVSRIARTGLIKQASPCLDYISLRAFIKEGIRVSSNNEHFTFWLPLFFGNFKDRTLHLGKKAISMICSGHTKRFKDTMILDLFPKIMTTLGVEIMNEKRHPSIRIFRIFFHIHYLYLTFLDENQHLYQEITRKIKEFNTSESTRDKDAIPSLGAFLTNFLIDWDSLDGTIDTVLQEQLDRQVLWLLKEIPELEDDSTDTYLDDKRALICFKSRQSSYQAVLFWVMVSKFFKKKFKSLDQLREYYQANFGRLTNQDEDMIQKNCFAIFKINSYDEMFQYLNKGKISQEELNLRLKEAIKNSKRRKYHGTDDEILALPSKEEQINNMTKNLPKLSDFVDTNNNTLMQVSEEQWAKACMQRWAWIQRIYENYGRTQAYQLAQLSDEYFSSNTLKRTERVAELKEAYLQNTQWSKLPTQEQRYTQDFTWRDLFIKLDLEEMLLQFDNNPDFKEFYSKIQTVKPYVTSLMLPIINVKNLKSGHHYLTGLLSQLTNLKRIEIVGAQNGQLGLAALKSLAKGFNNFVKEGGNLDEIIYNNFQITQFSTTGVNDISEQLYSPLRSLNKIKTLTLQNNNMLSFRGSKTLSDVITTHKNLKVLNLVNVGLNDTQAKEIADGLMRAKQLEVLNISRNTAISSVGLNSIIYNLAFSPKLLTLDISHISVTASVSNLVESLYKLLRISGSLEVLNLGNCRSLNCSLPEAFFISLGESRTLKKLILTDGGLLSDNGCVWLGKAIAFNAKKYGSLEVVSLKGNVIGSLRVPKLFSGMLISNADEETWYGDATKVSKMSGQDFAKTYYNNLKVLDLGINNLVNNFDYATWKKQYNPEDPAFVKLISRTPSLINLQLNSCQLNRNDADLLMLALDPTRPNFASHLKILQLSCNRFGKEGTKTLASVLQNNNTLEILDLSHNALGVSGAKALALSLTHNKKLKYLNLFANKIDVDGARAFEETLKSNTALEFIDFGHNRLRNAGLNAIAKGISGNPKSSLKYLGLRFNFIDADGIMAFLKKVYPEGAKNSLEEIFIKNNNINELGLNDIMKIYQKLNVKLSVDIFDKFQYLENNILERTIWIHPALGTEQEVKHFFENTHKCGVVLSIRKRTGPKWPNRKLKSNTFYFVEFAHPTSVLRALHIASRKEAVMANTRFRIYKAGSGTYNFTKTNGKKVGRSRTNVLNSLMKRRRRRVVGGNKLLSKKNK